MSIAYRLAGRRGSMATMFETFDHTADLGLRVQAPDVDGLFVEAAAALFSTIVEDLAAVAPRQAVGIELANEEVEYLLFDWLKTLLYHFDAEHLVFARFEVHIDGGGLKGKAWGEPLDRSRHELSHEVKAITYHGLRVERTEDGYLAEVIVDI
jgi:SHS2 domain-containing protein